MNEALLEPIAAGKPCGEDLENTALLASFDAFRLFGEPTSPDARPDPRDPAKRLPPPPWGEIKTQALDTLRKSKDLRLLAYLGVASLRTDGLGGFADTLTVASEWLKTYWAETYPRIDGDALLRRSALDCFADPMAVIDGLRRLPLVDSRRHGRFSLRDVDIATGQLQPGESDVRSDEVQIKAAFNEMPAETLDRLSGTVSGAVAALKNISAAMSAGAGSEAAPDFDALLSLLTRMSRTLTSQRPAQSDPVTTAALDPPASVEPGAVAVGSIKSRQDAIRALEAVAEFFRRNEPSSPIPLLVDRAKRLVSKSFLEVLADVAPSAVSQARSAGGLDTE